MHPAHGLVSVCSSSAQNTYATAFGPWALPAVRRQTRVHDTWARGRDVCRPEALDRQPARAVPLEEDIGVLGKPRERVTSSYGRQVELRGALPAGSVGVEEGERREIGRGDEQDVCAVCYGISSVMRVNPSVDMGGER